MKRASVSFLLILIVFVSGCVGQPGGVSPSSNGVIIKSFAPDFSEVRSGEFVPIVLSVENVGEAQAKDIKAELFGISSPEWKLQSGDWKQTLSSLIGANPSQNVKGETYEFSWGLIAPSIKVDNIYTADTRIHYKYSTSVLSTLRFMTYDYLKSLPTEQQESIKKTTGVVQTSVSGAPISISVSAGARPLVIYQAKDKFSLQITINNVGSGNAFSTDVTSYPPVSAQELNKIKVSISTPSNVPKISCSALGGTGSGDIYLTKGKTKTIFCDMEISSSDVGTKKEYTADISLKYGYYMDSSTTIKVLKTEVPPETIAPTACKDTETNYGLKGDDIWKAGTCTDTTDHPDKCASDTILEEWYCSDNKCKSKDNINCNTECINKGYSSGACITSNGISACSCADTARFRFEARRDPSKSELAGVKFKVSDKDEATTPSMISILVTKDNTIITESKLIKDRYDAYEYTVSRWSCYDEQSGNLDTPFWKYDQSLSTAVLDKASFDKVAVKGKEITCTIWYKPKSE